MTKRCNDKEPIKVAVRETLKKNLKPNLEEVFSALDAAMEDGNFLDAMIRERSPEAMAEVLARYPLERKEPTCFGRYVQQLYSERRIDLKAADELLRLHYTRFNEDGYIASRPDLLLD
jgi:hypothetical protein